MKDVYTTKSLLNACPFYARFPQAGGAVYVLTSLMAISYCTFANNRVYHFPSGTQTGSAYAGAMFVKYTPLNISDSTFTGGTPTRPVD
jgi:hypothetical protein